MGRIWLLTHDDSTVADEVARRIDAHFGQPPLAPPLPHGDAWQPGDVVVLLLERPAGSAALHAGSLWPTPAEPLIELVLGADSPLIPVLVNGATMPPADALPPPIRQLAFKHALPIRSGPSLPRDAGRLLEDIESQLRRQVGNQFPHDYWLLPIGILLVAWGLAYSIVFFRDVSDWSFAYSTVDQLDRAVRILTAAGPLALGTGSLMIAAARWRRRTRIIARRRADHFRHGAGELPERASAAASACCCAGSAALGWGVFAAAPAAACAARAWRSRGPTPLTPRDRRAISVGLVFAVVGGAWTTDLWRRQRQLRAAIVQYEAGRRERTAGKPAEAAARFEQATRLAPHYVLAYFELAQLYADQGQDDKALAAADQAVAHFPLHSQGMFEPTHKVLADVFRMRSDIHRRRGESDLAERDRKAAAEVNPWIVLFGGAFRFWEDDSP